MPYSETNMELSLVLPRRRLKCDSKSINTHMGNQHFISNVPKPHSKDTKARE